MKNEIKIFIIIVFILLVSIVLIMTRKRDFRDTVTHNEKTYVYLETNMDIFNYDFNNINNNYYEVDIIHKIPHDKWDMIYFNGDLFVYEKEVKKAIEYYKDDVNYDWSVIIEKDEIENEFPISVSAKELKYLYNMDNVKKEETMLFDEIEKFGTLKKTSKDKTISASICLAYFNNSWYYRTEIIDINKENDAEYVIKLPDSLNKKINGLEGDL